MDTQVVIVLIAAILIALLGVGVWYYVRRTTSRKLKDQFGPEYDHTVTRLRSEELAEAELKERKKRVSKYKIVSLPRTESARYQQSWMTVQRQFVDQPETAVNDADRLVREVMEKRGYPVTHFEQSAADLSVDYPDVVDNYRAAHRIAERSRGGRADTEELREALVYYRALFQELLEISEPASGENEPAYTTRRESRRHRPRGLNE
jgi:FtsZ-interacting cell division protein ZipA